jgi:hypothetical protein
MILTTKNKTYSCLGWWESTKWISWKEFAQTGREKVCDKVKINKDFLHWEFIKYSVYAGFQFIESLGLFYEFADVASTFTLVH